MKHLALLATLGLVLVGGPAHAQKVKRADVSGLRFVVGPKGDRPYLPGLNAVLMLTPEQAEKLEAAREETVGSETVRAAGRKVKGDPNATEAEREAARKAYDDAQAEYERRVAGILTPGQKELIQSLNVLYGQARDTAGAEYGQKLVRAKGNKEETERLREEARKAVLADFARRVNEILTPEQRAAFERAAAEEERREKAKG